MATTGSAWPWSQSKNSRGTSLVVDGEREREREGTRGNISATQKRRLPRLRLQHRDEGNLVHNHPPFHDTNTQERDGVTEKEMDSRLNECTATSEVKAARLCSPFHGRVTQVYTPQPHTPR